MATQSTNNINRLSRQRSVMRIEANPLESGFVKDSLNLKVDNLTDATLITADELKAIVKLMVATE
jgi:hypothetical protein